MTSQQLSADDAAIILERLPERIRAAMLDRANEIEYPIAPTAVNVCRLISRHH